MNDYASPGFPSERIIGRAGACDAVGAQKETACVPARRSIYHP